MNQLQLKMKQQIQKQNKGEWTMNREALLIVSNGQQCHKNHLSPEKVVTIGNTIEHEITYPELAEAIEVKYDEGSWNAGTTALQANQAVNVENLAFYLCQDLHTQVYDVVTNISVTFGVGIENDVTLDDTKSDFILLRDAKEKLFKLQVLNGEVYHNFSLVTEDCVLEPGDQLYTDGVTITIGKEDIKCASCEKSRDEQISAFICCGQFVRGRLSGLPPFTADYLPCARRKNQHGETVK